MLLLARYRHFSAPARAFLGGAALLELGHAFLWTLQNLYVVSLGYGEGDAGWVLTASAVGVLASTFPSAALYARLGPRGSLMASCLATGAAMAGLASVESLPLLMLCSFLVGASFTLHRVVAAPFIVAVSGPEDRTHLFSAEYIVHTLANAAGPLLAGAIASSLERDALPETGALRAALLVAAVLAAASVLAYRHVPRDLGDSARASPLLRAFTAEARPHWGAWLRLSVPQFLIGVGAGLTIPFMNLYFTKRFSLDKDELGLVLSCSALTMFVGALLTPRTIARIGLVRATIAAELLSIPFFLVLAFSTSATVAVVAYVLRSALMNLGGPIWRNFTMEITAPEWRAAVNGLSMFCWNAGWALSNHAGGRLIERSPGALGTGVDGYALPMLVTIGIYLLAIYVEARGFWRQRRLGLVVASGSPETPGEQAA